MRMKHTIIAAVALMCGLSGGLCNAQARVHPPRAHAAQPAKPAKPAATQITTAPAKDPKITPVYLTQLYQDAWFTVGEMYWDESKLTNWGDWEHKFDGKLNNEQDLDAALSQMVGSLHDLWTTYDSSHKRLLEAFASVRGIVDMGLLFKRDESGDYIVTLALFGGPAREAGIQPGDKLVSINNKPLRSLQPAEVADLLQASIKSEVPVTVIEAGNETEHTFIVKAVPSTRPLAEAKMLPGGILYARHSSFLDGETNGLFNQTVSETVEKAGTVNGMILDLRGNPGGQFELVQKEMSFFLPGKMIVSSVTREGNIVTSSTISAAPLAPFEYNMLPDRHKKMIDVFTKVPMIVLIDASTASAAEVMSGALIDNGRAIAVGVSTYKKGVGFKEIDVSLGGQLTVTNLKYFTPSGKDVSIAGITPQVVVTQPRDGTDRQLQVGLEVLQQRILELAKH